LTFISVRPWLVFEPGRELRAMQLAVFSRRWDHNDKYDIKKTPDGWYIQHLGISGLCDKSGSPFLFRNLEQDSINYPKSIGNYLKWLWDESTTQELGDDEIQNELNRISEWIQIVEKASPQGIFANLK
jgi:hypothetical protein